MRRSATAGLAAALVLSTVTTPAVAQTAGFDDVASTNVHAASIVDASNLGIVAGTTATSFAPARAVTRGQFASLLVRALEVADVDLPAAADAPDFDDLDGVHGDAVRRLAAAGIVSGLDAERFGPAREVSRGQLASVLIAALSFATGQDIEPVERGYFSDATTGVHAANIDAAAEQSLLAGRGDGTFAPLASSRRDQTATVTLRLLDVVRAAQAASITAGGELWALDQGTDTIHVYDASDGVTDVATIDVSPDTLRAARDAGDVTDAPAGERTVPHMIEFDSEHRYAFIAATAGGVVIVIDARTKQVVEVLATGGGTHMADVTPDDRSLWISVIGTAGRDHSHDGPAGTQKLVEVALPDLDAPDPSFEVTTTLLVEDLIAPWEDGTEASYEFPSLSAVCNQFSPDSSEAWITLGPGWNQGGLIVLDLATNELEIAYDPTVVRANCGLSITDEVALANWSGRVEAGNDSEGAWYVIDRETKELRDTRPSEGLDTHGLRLSPDGTEYWQVNRISDDALVIDAQTLEVSRRIDRVAATPDILDFSPDGALLHISQRGPVPRSGAVHAAAGSDPGVAVIDRATGERVTVIGQAKVRYAWGAVFNDVHGLAVRPSSAD